jgi:RNA polymerase sigma-70 factor (ECF subfamily)
MTHADDLDRADAAFTALVRQASQEVDTVAAVSLDVEDMLTRLKRRAADSHAHATQTVQQKQKELQLVGATLTQAFSAPVQHVAHHPAVSSHEDRWDDNEWGEMAAAAMLRPDDGVRQVHTEGYAEASSDLSILVADAFKGNRAAIELLLSHIRPLIVRYCRARIARQEHSFAAADDVAQEVCLAVLTAVPGYRNQGRPFLAFVYGIAAHKVANWHRTAARNQAAKEAETTEKPPVDLNPERAAARVEMVEMSARMVELLRALPAKQREILVLRVVVGLSAEETADAIGSTSGAVRVAQHRALTRLRRELSRLELL